MSNSFNEIRREFLNYFVKQNHNEVKASPLVPHNDPTLMFVNSGMVQFKNYFTGAVQPPFLRATSSQKSIRAGGKHNDLNNVGYTARHHTFFEMLGNFSFGDYFKEDAIYFAWELLTKNFALDKNRLYATVYHDDEEAYKIWQKVAGFGSDRIIKIKTNDNFWSMGDTGPCGPCSEIFYDHGEHIFGGLPGTKDQDGDRYIEIWNMVFMQYEQIDKNNRILLPKQSIDTGMGLERIAAVLQNVHDNYDIDVFRSIIEASEDISAVKSHGENKFYHRIIADHLRSMVFLIADGVMPSNEGRGYVLRRIMRRAMCSAHQLGAKDPMMYKLVKELVNLMGDAYPEIVRAQDVVVDILKTEEERFKLTLDKGLRLLNNEVEGLSEGESFSGEVAFKLYDTFGFPADLTESILRTKNITFDHDKFDSLMNEQKQRARSAWAGSGENKVDNLWFDIKDKFGATEFLGYSFDKSEGVILSLINSGSEILSIDKIGCEFMLITNQTPFYAESGGQMGDIGYIHVPENNSIIKVLDTRKLLGSLHVHVCTLEQGSVKVGDNVTLSIDLDYRNNLRKHHSATHILHAVLRKKLGSHVTQKGSLVANNKLRFDISHNKAISKAELYEIESMVNRIIMENSSVKTKIMPVDDAISAGAMALFGEKYDDEVRVISMGSWHESVELCGGTHVTRTGDIGCFIITSESAIAAGVRRIEAVCGDSALEIINSNRQQLQDVSLLLKANDSEIISKLDSLISQNKSLDKKLADVQKSRLKLSEQELAAKALSIDEIRLLYNKSEQVDIKIIRSVAQEMVRENKSLVAVYLGVDDNKIAIIVAVSDDIITKYKAQIIAAKISAHFAGSVGGGKDDLAQSGAVISSIKQLNELENKDFWLNILSNL